MWPGLFGSGWVWSALVAAALLCFIVGVLGFLYIVTVRPARRPSEMDRAWHLYEEGDLTQAEWERKAAAAQTSSRKPRQFAVRPDGGADGN